MSIMELGRLRTPSPAICPASKVTDMLRLRPVWSLDIVILLTALHYSGEWTVMRHLIIILLRKYQLYTYVFITRKITTTHYYHIAFRSIVKL